MANEAAERQERAVVCLAYIMFVGEPLALLDGLFVRELHALLMGFAAGAKVHFLPR